jgi:DNA repair exonuclease SbcCD ATPase subunit
MTNSYYLNEVDINNLTLPIDLCKDKSAANLFKCTQCQKLPLFPRVAEDDSIICGNCSETYTSRKSSKPILKDLSKTQKHCLDHVLLKCPNHACSEIISYDNIFSHYYDCKYTKRTAVCTNCNQKVFTTNMRKEIEAHVGLCIRGECDQSPNDCGNLNNTVATDTTKCEYHSDYEKQVENLNELVVEVKRIEMVNLGMNERTHDENISITQQLSDIKSINEKMKSDKKLFVEGFLRLRQDNKQLKNDVKILAGENSELKRTVRRLSDDYQKVTSELEQIKSKNSSNTRCSEYLPHWLSSIGRVGYC